MNGAAVIATLGAAGVGGLLYQADQLARMARTEYGWRAGRNGEPIPERTMKQWSGIMQAAVNRARRHKVLPSRIIRTARGEKWSAWNLDQPNYQKGMAARGPGTPGYRPAFILALRVLLGGRPYANIGRRENFIHAATQEKLGREIPEWANVNPLLIGDTLFSGSRV